MALLLLDLIDELLVWSFKGIDVADDLVRLSMSCKKLAALTSSSRVLCMAQHCLLEGRL